MVPTKVHIVYVAPLYYWLSISASFWRFLNRNILIFFFFSCWVIFPFCLRLVAVGCIMRRPFFILSISKRGGKQTDSRDRKKKTPNKMEPHSETTWEINSKINRELNSNSGNCLIFHWQKSGVPRCFHGALSNWQLSVIWNSRSLLSPVVTLPVCYSTICLLKKLSKMYCYRVIRMQLCLFHW